MPGKYHITPAGAKTLRDELKELWRVTRPAVTRDVKAAAALGDRSENADYIYGKKRLREIDKRIRYLQKRIDDLLIVDRVPDDREKVYFGAWVRLEDENGKTSTVRIVGSDEFDPKQGWISVDSPVAKGLVGKKIGASALVKLPEGEVEWTVLEVSYEPFPALPNC